MFIGFNRKKVTKVKIKLTLTSIAVFTGLFTSTAFSLAAHRVKYIRPEECNQAKYSCVLKKVDGQAFYCMQETRNRYKNARKSVRSYTQLHCVDRFPALVDPSSLPQPPKE